MVNRDFNWKGVHKIGDLLVVTKPNHHANYGTVFTVKDIEKTTQFDHWIVPKENPDYHYPPYIFSKFKDELFVSKDLWHWNNGSYRQSYNGTYVEISLFSVKEATENFGILIIDSKPIISGKDLKAKNREEGLICLLDYCLVNELAKNKKLKYL